MANLQAAKKRTRQEKKRTAQNKARSSKMKSAIHLQEKKPTKKNLSKAYASIDKAAKKRVIHKNKAARLKSQLARANA